MAHKKIKHKRQKKIVLNNDPKNTHNRGWEDLNQEQA